MPPLEGTVDEEPACTASGEEGDGVPLRDFEEVVMMRSPCAIFDEEENDGVALRDGEVDADDFLCANGV